MDRKQFNAYVKGLPPGAAVTLARKWTMAEVESFYKAWEQGKVPEREAEVIDAQITRANAEGRIVG